MIERTGDALVAYLDADLQPVAKQAATLWKVRYDDGRILFVKPLPGLAKGLPDQPRDEHGRFGPTGWSRESTAGTSPASGRTAVPSIGHGVRLQGGVSGTVVASTEVPQAVMDRLGARQLNSREFWVKGNTPGQYLIAHVRDVVDSGPQSVSAHAAYFQQLRDLGQNEPSLTPHDTAEVRGARLLQARQAQTADINTPERVALRQQIADRLYGAGAKVKGREAWIVLGPPAAGKSSVLAEPIAAREGALIIDSDQAKPHLPEYTGNNAGVVHDESSDIVNGALLKRALQNGDNIVLPVVGKTASNITGIADRLQASGYKVHALMNDLPPDEAAKRAVSRFLNPRPGEAPRFVDPNYVLNLVGTRPRQTYEILKGHPAVVDYTAFDNNVPRGQRARLIESGRTAAGASAGRGGRGANPADAGRASRQVKTSVVVARPAGSVQVVVKTQAVLPMTDFKAIGKGHVRVLVIDAGGRLLLLHWAKGWFRPSDWGPVQGTIGDEIEDETPRDAAARELLEETGYGGETVTWRVIYPNCWLVQLPPGASAPTISEEHNAYRWLSAADTAIWVAREEFYGQWTTAARRTKVRKQGPHDPHLAALLVHGAQLDDWGPLARAIAEPLGEAGAEAAVQAFDDLGADDPGAFDVANQAATDWAHHRAAVLVRNVEDRTRVGIRDLVTQALGEGWSSDDLAQAIEDDYLFSADRADVIARTELALAHSNGTLASWRATGQVAGKRNLLSDSHMIEDECDDNTAVGVIPLTESFPSGDDGPPYHPRCMCVVVPELVPPEEGEVAKYAVGQSRDPHGQFAYEGGGKRYTPKGEFAILTAANPNGQARDAKVNAQANRQLARELGAKGYHPVAVTGHYTDTTTGKTLTEPSFLVSGINAHTTVALGYKYGQNSVITNEGLHDLQGKALVPSTGFVEPTDAYTQLPGGRRLSLGLDWSRKMEPRWGQEQMVAETARLQAEDAYYAQINSPGGLEHRMTAAEFLGKRHGPRWTVAVEFSPEAWRVMRRLHLQRVP